MRFTLVCVLRDRPMLIFLIYRVVGQVNESVLLTR